MDAVRKEAGKMRTFLWVICALVVGLEAATPVPNDSQKIILTYPDSGTFKVGDTLNVDWVCVNTILYVDILLSPDNGKTWMYISGSSIWYEDSVSWCHFKWIIPAEIIPPPIGMTSDTFVLSGDRNCLVRVQDYSPADSSYISTSAKPITVLPENAAIRSLSRAKRTPTPNFQAILAGRGVSSSLLEKGGSAKFFDARGEPLAAGNQPASRIVFCVQSSEKAQQVQKVIILH
jgi:hypothetical protein